MRCGRLALRGGGGKRYDCNGCFVHGADSSIAIFGSASGGAGRMADHVLPQPHQAMLGEVERQARAGGGDFDDLPVHIEACGAVEGDFLVASAELEAAVLGEGRALQNK